MDAEVREKILDVASRLFLQYGHKRTTVEMIAAGAGMAKGSVYLHFQGKEEIFAAASRSLCRKVLDAMAATAAAALPVEVRIHNICLEASLYIWDFCHQAPHAPALWSEVVGAAGDYAASAYNEGAGILAGVIAEGQAQGVFSDALDAPVAARLLQIALQGFDSPYLFIQSRNQIETQLPQLLELFIQGLKAKPVPGTRSGEHEPR